MDILFLLIPLSVALVFLIGAVFWLALKGGQFDDLESPALDIVLDDDRHRASPESGTGPADGASRGRSAPGRIEQRGDSAGPDPDSVSR